MSWIQRGGSNHDRYPAQSRSRRRRSPDFEHGSRWQPDGQRPNKPFLGDTNVSDYYMDRMGTLDNFRDRHRNPCNYSSSNLNRAGNKIENQSRYSCKGDSEGWKRSRGRHGYIPDAKNDQARSRLKTVSPSPSHLTDSDDDVQGFFDCRPGEMLNERYRAIGVLGEGTFARVIECEDIGTVELVAVKVVRSVKKYYDDAKEEEIILEDLKRQARILDIKDTCCPMYYGSFSTRGHFCMVFERLGESLDDALKANGYRPFAISQIRQWAKDMLGALDFIHRAGYAHTDLKSPNVLFRTRRSLQEAGYGNRRVCVIDFGGTRKLGRHPKLRDGIVQTRQYRAPEVILGIGWGYECDLWSVGCILMELYIGDLLLPVHDTEAHLALICQILGPFPRDMIPSVNHETSKYFCGDGRLRYPYRIGNLNAWHVRDRLSLGQIIERKHESFCCLVRNLLRIDPAKRPKPHEALRFDFFGEVSDGQFL